jgi:hypothetical protein
LGFAPGFGRDVLNMAGSQANKSSTNTAAFLLIGRSGLFFDHLIFAHLDQRQSHNRPHHRIDVRSGRHVLRHVLLAPVL